MQDGAYHVEKMIWKKKKRKKEYGSEREDIDVQF
jgi:hypothetical protein